MNIGEKIKNIRIAHNMTQEQLSDLSGISLPSIRKYEAGDRNPKSDQLLKISEALGVSINLFLEFDIRTVSDLLSLIFRMNDQTDMRIEADTDENGLFIPESVRLTFADDTVNQKLCSYLSALKEKTALEAIKSTLTESEFSYRSTMIQKTISDLINRLLDDNTPLTDNSVADSSMQVDADVSNEPMRDESFITTAYHRELQNLVFDCSEDEISLLIENARLLKNFIRKKRT